MTHVNHAGEWPLIASYWAIAGPNIPGAEDLSSSRSVEERLAAVASAGFRGVGLNSTDVRDLLERDGARSFATEFALSGLEFLELEVLTDWYLPAADRQKSDTMLGQFLDFSARVPVRHLKIGGAVGDAPAELHGLVAGLQRVSDAAAADGVQVTLEFMPFSDIPSLDLAREAVSRADRENLGLLIDVWHVARAGVSYDDIAALDGALVNYVEISDAAVFTGGGLSLFEDTIYNRLLPGDGIFDVPSFLMAVRTLGYVGPIGVEVISRAQADKPLHAAAHDLYAAARATILQSS